MNAADVMTTGACTVRPDTGLAEAAQLMVEHRISGLPVVDAQDRLIGIITEGDFLRPRDGHGPRVLEFLASDWKAVAADLASHRVEDLMTRNPVAVAVDTPLDEIVDLMNRHNIKRLPVATDGKVVGIISRANLLKALVRRSQAGPRRR
jgi:CBS domain-containing protein